MIFGGFFEMVPVVGAADRMADSFSLAEAAVAQHD